MVRQLVLCVDSSTQARYAADFALRHIVPRPLSALQLHLVTVLPPFQGNIMPAAPLTSSSAMHAIHNQWDAQMQQEHATAHDLLKKMAEVLAEDYKVPHDSIHLHVLPALGGASGVAESLVEAATKLKASLLVLGTRGMGSIKSALMSFIGLGSVSDYCLHHATVPVLVVRHASHEINCEASPQVGGIAPPPKKVMISVDESPQAQETLKWYLSKTVMPNDHLHIVSVALSPPLMLSDESSAVVAAEKLQSDSEAAAVVEGTQKMVQAAVEAAQEHGVLKGHITSAVLSPKNGSSDVGQALVQYAKEKEVELVVVGSRGLGAWKRSLMSAMGLGSVSDFLAHNLACPLLVVKDSAAAAASGEETSMLLSRLDEDAEDKEE